MNDDCISKVFSLHYLLIEKKITSNFILLTMTTNEYIVEIIGQFKILGWINLKPDQITVKTIR